MHNQQNDQQDSALKWFLAVRMAISFPTKKKSFPFAIVAQNPSS
jgi:hypothetical protein